MESKESNNPNQNPDPNNATDPVEDWSNIRPKEDAANSAPVQPSSSSSFYLKVSLFLIIIIASLLIFKYAESRRSSDLAQSNELVMVEGQTIAEQDSAEPDTENQQRLNAVAANDAMSKSLNKTAGAYKTASLIMAGKGFTAEISDTSALRELGLSNRTSIAADSAMIFIFPQDGRNMFWMKDMNFDIDMIWLDSNKKVIYIAERATPESYPQTFGPLTPSRYVIEVKSGMANKIGLKVGDTVSF